MLRVTQNADFIDRFPDRPSIRLLVGWCIGLAAV